MFLIRSFVRFLSAPLLSSHFNSTQFNSTQKWNTVPQLYLIRSPPYNGRDSETLVGGADDMFEKMRTPLW